MAESGASPWYLKLHWQVIVALVLGAAAGTVLPEQAQRIGFVGDVFLRLLKMIIIPLIFTSLVSGVASLGDARVVGRVGIRTLLYYTLTTTLAISVGLVLVNVLRPGDGLELGVDATYRGGISMLPSTPMRAAKMRS